MDQQIALSVLDEIGEEQARFQEICDGIGRLTTPEGGLPCTLPSVADLA